MKRVSYASAGDVVLFRSEVWHRGSANTSNEVRYLMQVHYAQSDDYAEIPTLSE